MQLVHDEGEWTYDDLVQMVDESDEGISLSDSDGAILFSNAAGAATVGLVPEQMVGRNLLDFGRGTMHDLQRTSIKAAVVNHVEITVRNCVLPTGDGNVRRYDLTMTPVRTERGTVVAVSIREPRDKYHQTKLFRALLEAAPDGMVIVNRDGEIVLVNDQAEHLFGYSREELIGQTIEILVPDRFHGMHVAFRTGYVSDARARPMGLAGDLHGRRQDGTEFPIEVTLSPLDTEDGLLVSAAVRDITERRRVQEQADRVKDEFFATVSHELRTPLTSMIGYGELMSDLEDLSPQGRRFLSVILRSAERELRLVDDLLTLVAVEETGMSIRSAEIDIEKVVRDAVEAARPRAEEARLSLAVETPGFAIPMYGDSDRLGQALDNLVSNAIKFTPADGTVRVVLRTSGSNAVVEVVDSGIGIDTDDPDLLFERLFRGPNAVAAEAQGAGLGLTIALAIVEAHAGTIEVVDSTSAGTTFRMTFPLRRVDQ